MTHTRPASLAGILNPFVDCGAVAGAVALVADKDSILSLDAVGYADMTAGKAMQPDSLFWIASQTKPITASLLMMLVDEGRVRVEDPVEAYLPEFKGQWLSAEQDEEHALLKKPRHPITVRNILTHTSGMPFKSEIEEPTRDLLPLETAVRSYAMTPLLFQPDSRYLYSNAGINTAGRIVEVVSGMPYEEFLQKRLLDPLGLADTAFRPNAGQLKRLAKLYKPNADGTALEETSITQLTSPFNDPRRKPMPAGGLFSTAADVARFCRMILKGGVFDGKRYLSEAAVREMTRKQTPDVLPDGYGLGWATDGSTFGHGGACATHMSIDSKLGLVLVFLVQHSGFLGNGVKCLGAFQSAARERFGK